MKKINKKNQFTLCFFANSIDKNILSGNKKEDSNGHKYTECCINYSKIITIIMITQTEFTFGVTYLEIG